MSLSLQTISSDRCIDCGGVVTVYVRIHEHAVRTINGVKVNCIGKPVPQEGKNADSHAGR